ncbi:MAG TPA: hypothetical protein VNS09_04735 [Solirubrobacter sp.]|nr:hypothetical protein [Solirubrobacter sp.]
MRGLVLAVAVLAITPAAAQARVASAPPAVVSLGDSAISGEAGRWAGNTNGSSARTDALGPTAYDDAGTREAIAGCHRSASAEVHIGDGVASVNLACSGARTATRPNKPGIDFSGQAAMLRDVAAAGNVKAVVVLIGANDYGFADIVETCVLDWLTSPAWWKNYCQDDANLVTMFSAANIAKVTAAVRGAFDNVRSAMAQAGYTDADYEILAQTYSAPLPLAAGMRYPETGWTRQAVGGCGVWNKDVNWARNTVVEVLNRTVRDAVAGMPNVQVLDMVDALNGRRLCESTVGLLEEKGVATWRSAGAVDKTEWVQQIRTVTAVFPPYQVQEDGHPNYWGQLALRNCLRQAFAGGAAHGGKCVRGTGLSARGEPNMTLG